MKKGVILFLYGVSVYIVVSRWYKAGNSGIPSPQVVGPPSYLFGVLALTADFLGGLPVVLAAGLTFILWQRKGAIPATTGTVAPHNKTAPNAFSPTYKAPQPAAGSNVFAKGYQPPTQMKLGGTNG